MDNTYIIPYWYYYGTTHGDISVATTLSISDLQMLVSYAFELGVWAEVDIIDKHGVLIRKRHPNCGEIYMRIHEGIVYPILRENAFLAQPGSMSVIQNGLQMTFECNGQICTSNELEYLLQLSGNTIDRVKLIYSSGQNIYAKK
jgi:hypothetical protein